MGNILEPFTAPFTALADAVTTAANPPANRPNYAYFSGEDEEAPPSTSSSSSTTSSASPPLDEGEAVTRAVIATPSRDLEEDVAPDDPNLQESTSKQNKRRRARRARLQPRNRNRE